MITAHSSAPEGQVLHLQVYSPCDFPPGSAILCRNVAPLISFAYALLQRDIPCRVLGRDIGAQLSTIVEKMRATNLEDLQARLDTWHRREFERLSLEGLSTEKIDDQHTCLLYFIDSLDEQSRSIASLLAKIDLMFGEAKDLDFRKIVVLSSVHKAKGFEWRKVFILDRHLMPSKYARQPWQQLQERNLAYVAVTRAQETLAYILSNQWKQQ